jgi:hypothetical protein
MKIVWSKTKSIVLINYKILNKYKFIHNNCSRDKYFIKKIKFNQIKRYLISQKAAYLKAQTLL